MTADIQVQAVQRKTLETALWAVANSLRGKMDPDEYRKYILGLIFYKFLSDQMAAKADGWLAEDPVMFGDLEAGNPAHAPYLAALSQIAVGDIGYALFPWQTFSHLAKRGKEGAFILKDLRAVLADIQTSTLGTESEEEFSHLFDDLDLDSIKLGRTPDQRNAVIAKVMDALDGIDFGLDAAEGDVLGDAYEYLIGAFASDAGKKAGEFYTPQSVSTLLARIVAHGKTRLRSVYDPTCGSGSLLLRVAKHLDGKVDRFVGQELNPTTHNLARMNMIMHGVHYSAFDIQQGDTLEDPRHLDARMEAVVANPPFSAHWNAKDSYLQDDRFGAYGVLAPAKKADFAFVLHMLHHLDDNGTMAVVLPHGVLFRGGKEGTIRQILVQDRNVLDAVIGLPANIFYGTTIPTCILVFKPCRENDDVLFVDGSSFFLKGKNQNTLRPADIDAIFQALINRQDVDKVARKVAREEIAANGYNLNISRYINTHDAGEDIDLNQVSRDIAALKQDTAKTDEAIRAFCAELGLEAPV